MAKIRIGVVFGGKSAEHEISLISAKNVMDALDKDKYEVVPIGITKEGKWLINSSKTLLLNTNDPKTVAIDRNDSESVALVPAENETGLVDIEKGQTIQQIDVVFPVMHGVNGEDGSIQGFLRMANLPFVGPDLLGSAVGMDKDVMKRLLKEAGIPISKFIVKYRNEKIDFQEITEELGLPIFIKPANTGSLIGISKAHNEEEFDKAVEEALKFDRKLVFEEAIVGREIEVAVLGNEDPEASIPGEVIPHHEFYDFEAKYIDENGAALEIPAKLTDDEVKKIQETAIKTFRVLCCEGMSRVDGFLTKDGEFIINEINTIPGFTKISMYPKLWEASGLPYSKLIDRLVELAIERFEREKEIETNYKAL